MALTDLERSRILRPKQQAAKDYIASRKQLISQTRSLRQQGATTQQVASFVQSGGGSVPHTPVLPNASSQPNEAELKKYSFTSVITKPEPVKTGGISTFDRPVSYNQIVLSSTQVPPESKVASAIASTIAGSGSQNMTIRPATSQGYEFTSEKVGGGLLGVEAFKTEREIAISRATGKKYIVERVGASNTDVAYKTFLVPYSPSIQSAGIFSPSSRGLDTSKAIDFSSGQQVSKSQSKALDDYLTDKKLREKSQTAAVGLGTGGIAATTKVAAKSVGAKAAKLTLFQTARNLAASGGLYAISPILPETARQTAIGLNPDVRGINFNDKKLQSIVRDAYNKTNRKVYGGTTRTVDETGAVLKEETSKPEVEFAQTVAYSLFPPLRAVEGGDTLPYAREFTKYIKPKLKAAGYSDKQANAIIDVELKAAQTGGAAGLITTEVASEIGFRTVAAKTLPGFMQGTKGGTLKQGAKLGAGLGVMSFPFGVAEGITGLETVKQSERSTSTTGEKIQAGVIGGVMASSFNVVGGVLTGRFGRTGGKVTQYAGWGLDFPGEPIGDFATDALTRGKLNVAIPGRVTTAGVTAPSTTDTVTKTKGKTDSAIKTNLDTLTKAKTDTKTQPADSIWISSRRSIVVPTTKPTVSTNILKPSSTTDTPTKADTDTTTPTETGTQTGVPTQTNLFEQVTNQTSTEVNVNVTAPITTPTSVNVPIVTPAGLPFFPFLPFGSIKPSKLRGKRLKYYDEFADAQKQLKRLGGFR